MTEACTTEGAAAMEAEERRCACGLESSMHAPFSGGHMPSACYVGDAWIKREQFAKPPRELWEIIGKTAADRDSAQRALDHANERLADKDREWESLYAQKERWKAAAIAQAALLAPEVAP
jgi:hypothetical protein